MANLKTYTISTNITGGVLDINKLHNEILTSGDVTGFSGITHTGGSDTFDIHGTSFVNETNCDTTVSNHVPAVVEQVSALRHTWIDADKSVANSGTFNSIVCNASPTAILYDRWVFRAQAKNSEDVCCFEFELRDDYIDGNDITIEIVWTTSETSGTAVYNIGLCVPNGVNFGGDSNTTYVVKNLSAPATANWEQLTFKHTFSGTSLKVGDSLNFVILRNGGNGADNMNGSSYIRGIKIVY